MSHKIDVSKELDANFNIPMIHLMSHWVEPIRRYGGFQLYSPETYEQALLDRLQSRSRLPATSNHHLAPNALLENQRA